MRVILQTHLLVSLPIDSGKRTNRTSGPVMAVTMRGLAIASCGTGIRDVFPYRRSVPRQPPAEIAPIWRSSREGLLIFSPAVATRKGPLGMRANYSIARRSRNQTMRRSSSEDQVVSNEHEYGNKTPAGRSKTIFSALAAVNGKPCGPLRGH